MLFRSDLRGAEEATASFPAGVGLTVDVADEAAVRRMTDEAVERYGSIDVLVNNAGLYASLEMRVIEHTEGIVGFFGASSMERPADRDYDDREHAQVQADTRLDD